MNGRCYIFRKSYLIKSFVYNELMRSLLNRNQPVNTSFLERFFYIFRKFHFLERVIYMMQLKRLGLDNYSIKNCINDLFQCHMIINTD